MIASKRMLEKLLKFKGLYCYPIVFDHIDYTGEIFWPCKAYKPAKMINILDYKNLKVAVMSAECLFWGMCPVWIRAIMKAVACAGGV